MTVLISLGCAVATATVVMAVTALVAHRQVRVVVVDVAWGLGFVAIGAVCAAVAAIAGAGDALRTTILVTLVAVWGLRLSGHIAARSRGDREEDPRYLKVLGGSLDEVGIGVAIRKVFAVQGVAMAVIAAPMAVGAALDVDWWPVVVIGAVLWLVGLFFEAVGDAQLAAYRRRPRDERPPVLDTGLWRYTRHPNYFGDACVWWGVWLIGGAASGWVPAAATLVAPVAMSWFLIAVTGVRMTEEKMLQRPAYRAYADRTSMFVPLPPRR